MWLRGAHVRPLLPASQRQARTRAAAQAAAAPSRDRAPDRQDRREGITLVPTRIYFKGPRAKVEIALAKGKEGRDRRREIQDRDQRREVERDYKQRLNWPHLAGRSAREPPRFGSRSGNSTVPEEGPDRGNISSDAFGRHARRFPELRLREPSDGVRRGRDADPAADPAVLPPARPQGGKGRQGREARQARQGEGRVPRLQNPGATGLRRRNSRRAGAAASALRKRGDQPEKPDKPSKPAKPDDGGGSSRLRKRGDDKAAAKPADEPAESPTTAEAASGADEPAVADKACSRCGRCGKRRRAPETEPQAAPRAETRRARAEGRREAPRRGGGEARLGGGAPPPPRRARAAQGRATEAPRRAPGVRGPGRAPARLRDDARPRRWSRLEPRERKKAGSPSSRNRRRRSRQALWLRPQEENDEEKELMRKWRPRRGR